MGFLLQDWIDIEGSGNGEIIQSATRWLDLSGYRDVLFVLEVPYSPAGAQLHMNYETAPAIDPTLFTNMATGFSMVAGTTTTKVYLSQNPLVPLAGLVRWRIDYTAAGNWTVMFRIHGVAKRKGW